MDKSTLKLKSANLSIFFVIMVSVTLFFSNNIQAQTYDFPALIDKVATDRYTSGPKPNWYFENVSTMDSWVANQNYDGSWYNISFDNHLWRLWYLAAAATIVI